MPPAPIAVIDVKLPTVIAELRFVVVPSNWDVFNLAAAEAMSLGRVVVCSSGAGASDLVANGESGFVFQAGDSGSLAKALNEAAGLSDAARKRIGEAARRTIVDRLNPDVVAVERLARYRDVQSRRVPAPAAAPDWLREVFAGEPGQVGTDFLDQQNVRDLSKYLGRRLRSRLVNRVSKGAS